jgi:hypothetical protein
MASVAEGLFTLELLRKFKVPYTDATSEGSDRCKVQRMRSKGAI